MRTSTVLGDKMRMAVCAWEDAGLWMGTYVRNPGGLDTAEHAFARLRYERTRYLNRLGLGIS